MSEKDLLEDLRNSVDTEEIAHEEARHELETLMKCPTGNADTSLKDQLIAAKQEATDVQILVQSLDVQLNHCCEILSQKEHENEAYETAFLVNNSGHAQLDEDLANLKYKIDSKAKQIRIQKAKYDRFIMQDNENLVEDFNKFNQLEKDLIASFAAINDIDGQLAKIWLFNYNQLREFELEECKEKLSEISTYQQNADEIISLNERKDSLERELLTALDIKKKAEDKVEAIEKNIKDQEESEIEADKSKKSL